MIVLCPQGSDVRTSLVARRDGRVEINEYHAAREILEKTGRIKYIQYTFSGENMRNVNLLNIAKGR